MIVANSDNIRCLGNQSFAWNTMWILEEESIHYEDLATALERVPDDFAVFTVDPPWSSCAKLLKREPRKIIFVQETDIDTLEHQADALQGTDCFVGVGGGRAIDSAKYAAWKNGAKFVSVPTILGADAYVTPSAAVRKDGIVSYLGTKFADEIVVDFSMIRSAPPRLNRAGIGDIYSAKISLLDWQYARDNAGELYDESTAARAEKVLDRLRASKKEIYDVSEVGIRSLVEMHLELNALQFPYFKFGKTWPQEGTEHVFFYSLEKVTGRTFSHGEVLGTGAVVAAKMHGHDAEEIVSDLDSYGLQFRPRDYGISFDDFEQAIRNMLSITKAMNTRYLILESNALSHETISELWKLLLPS